MRSFLRCCLVLLFCFYNHAAIAKPKVAKKAPLPPISVLPLPKPKPEVIQQIDAAEALPPDIGTPENTPVETAIEAEKKEVAAVAPTVLCDESVFDILAVGARLRITILNHEDISRESEIGPKGTITIPLIGAVQAEGETTKSLAELIQKRLDAAYMITPGVDVEIVQYQPIYMTGLVAVPGLYNYKSRITVRQAIAMAGGFSPRARSSEVRILRRKPRNPLEQVEVISGLDDPVFPGDTIEALQRWF